MLPVKAEVSSEKTVNQSTIYSRLIICEIVGLWLEAGGSRSACYQLRHSVCYWEKLSPKVSGAVWLGLRPTMYRGQSW